MHIKVSSALMASNASRSGALAFATRVRASVPLTVPRKKKKNKKNSVSTLPHTHTAHTAHQVLITFLAPASFSLEDAFLEDAFRAVLFTQHSTITHPNITCTGRACRWAGMPGWCAIRHRGGHGFRPLPRAKVNSH